MFIKHAQIAPARMSAILNAAEAAARAIPPAFPLEATVAVNPFLGQSGEDLTRSAARLARVAGAAVTQPRARHVEKIDSGQITDDDLAAALIECPSALKPADLALLKAKAKCNTDATAALPTVADLAMLATGTDWPALIARSFGLWAAGHFDRGQALWTPAPGQGAYAAWRDWARHDLTPELGGLDGFCAHVAQAPDTADRAILRTAEALAITGDAAETAFHRLLVNLGGWSQHARWLSWQAEKEGGCDPTLTDLLAIRLIWEEALLTHLPALADEWAAIVKSHAAPLVPTPDQVIDTILQDAAERAFQRDLFGDLGAGQTGAPTTGPARPALQAAFCIDVRSEPFRRALEELDPGIDTIGFAGFFGLPVAYRAQGSDVVEAHLPVLLSPGLHASSQGAPAQETQLRIKARATRALGRFRQAAVSSFAFVEATGPFYAGKLIRDALGLTRATAPSPAPELDPGLSAEAKAATGAAVLKAMSLTTNHAPLVLLLGHGAQTVNNPHASAYHCGACGGHTGEVSARLLATLLNDPETRAGLPAHGVDVPADTLFMAGLHDTTTDRVTLFHDRPAPSHAPRLARAQDWLDRAGGQCRAERALRLPGARAETVAGRARNWAETRPEWGLAGCAAFVAAPRSVTRGRDLAGRAFLHSYDWRRDRDFATLEMILTAPVVVASWISLQYYGSAVAPDIFGSGNKLIHNVTGGFGVVEGNGGRLRAGLPWQAVHDGARLAHDPLRLSVLIEAPQTAILDVLSRHEGVRDLFDNRWMHLFALDQGQAVARYRPGLAWDRASGRAAA